MDIILQLNPLYQAMIGLWLISSLIISSGIVLYLRARRHNIVKSTPGLMIQRLLLILIVTIVVFLGLPYFLYRISKEAKFWMKQDQETKKNRRKSV